MSKEYVILGILVGLLLWVGISGYQKPSSPAPNKQITAEVKKKEEGSVDVSVQYLKEKSIGQTAVFEIALNTHSVNLDEFNFNKDVVIEKGQIKLTPQNVNASGSGHHRRAQVSFTKASPPFTVVVSGVAGINRREFNY